MKRKDFFKGLAFGTLSLPLVIRGLGGKSVGQRQSGAYINTTKTYEWDMVTTWPPNFPVLGEGCNLLARWVEEMSGGRMKIKVYGGGELVPALEAFDTVRSGAAQIGCGAAYYWAGKIPAAQFFASVPFGMNAQQLNAWIVGGGGLRLWEEIYAEFNLVPMVGGNTGVQMGGWFNREINSLEDLKGLKMRIPGLGGKVLERAGGSSVLIPGGELFTALERGVIDATEWIGPYHDYKMGFHQIAEYYYAPGWHEPGTALEFFVNKTLYDELPVDLQQIIQSAAAKLNNWMLSEFEAKNAIYLDKLIQEEHVKLRFFKQEILDKLRDYTAETLEEITASDPISRKVYDSYQSFRKKAGFWSSISEERYFSQIQEKQTGVIN
ncbi:MAG: TRAP transporter substrate-binding protein [Saprospiraceae bacterium]|nr:TRAP transporter substrate-binding protein [Saprospiraceae bacterium]